MSYTNHFGEQSSEYLLFRPQYPDALYSYLANLVSEHDAVWDCGTGNGQAAAKLAEYFKCVIATDIQQGQLDVAIEVNNVEYRCCPAEKTDIATASVDLVTIAQALHWFKFDEFYREVRRVAKPGAMIAAWTYSLGKMTPDINAIILKFYRDILGETYWPAERRYIDNHYQDVPFPFQKIQPPVFYIEKKMTLPALIGYLSTWSAVKEYLARQHQNPINVIYDDLLANWGDPSHALTMRWPIHLLVGKVES
jgi:SAM-dependent methyltransferase